MFFLIEEIVRFFSRKNKQYIKNQYENLILNSICIMMSISSFCLFSKNDWNLSFEMIVFFSKLKFISVKILFSTCKSSIIIKTRILSKIDIEICSILSICKQTKKANFSTQFLSIFSNYISQIIVVHFLFFLIISMSMIIKNYI